MIPRLRLFPVTARVNGQQHLEIGGCDTVELANEFGTPLYLFDEAGLRAKCTEFKDEFGQRYRDTTVIYACKAFINQALATILNEEGFGLDIVSAGELHIAQSSGLPLERVYYHGNNKSAEELLLALKWRVGRIVVDNFPELEMLSEITRERGEQPDIMLRLSPGVDPHTHKYITTGTIDSKFGFPMSHAEEAIAQAIKAPNLNLVGLHCHIGSLIFEVEPYLQTIEVVLSLAAKMKAKYGFELSELNIGGGFAIQYTLDRPAPPVSDYAEAITAKLTSKCQELKLAQPRLVIEPGRSVVGQSGVALYRVGVIKDIPQVRCYVSVDGGMGDNIRPALYQAEYEAMVANKMPAAETSKVTIAGRFCESGDILIRDIMLPPLEPGDIIAVPSCGAYCLPMASNYNASLKPAVVLVKDGSARLIRRRETFADLTGCDLV
jgi:diaminopimelate decarboxylase